MLSAIWVMNADGTNQHRLTPAIFEAFYPDWSPDGAHIIFTSNCCLPRSEVWKMRADGSRRTRITDFPKGHQGGFATYSPDGRRIVLIADVRHPDGCCNDLFTIRSDGTHRIRVVADQPAVLLSDWGPSR